VNTHQIKLQHFPAGQSCDPSKVINPPDTGKVGWRSSKQQTPPQGTRKQWVFSTGLNERVTSKSIDVLETWITGRVITIKSCQTDWNLLIESLIEQLPVPGEGTPVKTRRELDTIKIREEIETSAT